MDFNHSEIIEESSYETEGLCNGIPLRRHKDPNKEVQGALRAQKDWCKLVCPVSNYNGGLGNDYTFIRVTVPECLPERLEIISYANEFAFLYDGKSSKLMLQKGECSLTFIRYHGNSGYKTST